MDASTDLVTRFQSEMTAAGLDYQGPIIADGALHRFKVNGDHGPNSFYTLHRDHPAAGSFGCWKRGIKETWCAVGTEELSESERAERDRKWKQQQAERDAERRRYQAEAATKAQAILDTARPATDDHPYLVKKSVKAALGLLVGKWLDRENCLLIPLRTAAGQLATLQAISPDAPFAHSGQSKDFLKGGAKAGAYFVIGDLADSPVILIAEGYATAATLHEATGYASVMACDSGNLKLVAQAMKTLYPHPKIIMICGDNDQLTEGNPGVKAAKAAAKAVKVRVCIPDFATDEACSDFNDLAATQGLEAVKLAIETALAGRWQAGKEKVAGAESTPPPAAEGVAIHPDYCASQAGTFWIKHNEDGDKHVFLANFRAEIQSETLVDDGAVSTRRLEIAGILSTGDRLPLATCASGHFAQLNWVGEHWGTAAQIAPGIGQKDRLRYAIQVLSQNVQRRSVYAHTGWREVGSQWLYLSAGVCIGDAGAVNGIDMELPGSLADYELALSDHPAAAIKASLELLNCASPSISTPLFLAPYRALLSEALPVDFSLFLTGTTGSRKTELAALVQAHFGSRWHGKHLPAAWSSTANRLEQDAFRAKDAVLVVDDFCPGGATHDVARIHKEADRLLRAQGNRAGRGRMNADGSPRPAYYPRGLIVATGEDVPRGQSLRGRLLVLEFAPDTVNLAQLTTMQQHAGAGRLAAAAGAFCQWLAAQLTALKKTLPARFQQKRAELMGAGAHSRHPDTLAELIITAEMFAQFAADAGVVLAPDWTTTITEALLQAGKEQAQFIATEEPAGRFVRVITAALAAGLCHVKRKDGREPYASESEMSALGWQLRTFGTGDREQSNWTPQGPAIGWFEEHNLYLEPDAAYRTAAKFADEQGQALPLTQRSLFKAMESKGLIRSKQPNRITNNIRVGGEIKRVLHISRVYGENSGYNGYSGYKAQQPNDCKDENHVADSGYSENLAATSATDFADADPCVATVAGNVADKKTERLQNSECNYTADKDFSGPVADVADVAAFSHPLPPQSFPGDHPAPLSPLARRIVDTLAAAGGGGMAPDDLLRAVDTGKAGKALAQDEVNRLLLAGRVGKSNGRLVVAEVRA